MYFLRVAEARVLDCRRLVTSMAEAGLGSRACIFTHSCISLKLAVRSPAKRGFDCYNFTTCFIVIGEMAGHAQFPAPWGNENGM